MNSGFNILQYLQDHEVTPPSGMYDRICKRLYPEAAGNPDTARNNLEKLLHLEIQPPERLRTAIEQKIFSGEAIKQKTDFSTGKKQAKKITLSYPFRIAAACVLLLVSVLAIVRLVHQPADRTKKLAVKITPVSQAANAPAVRASDSSLAKNGATDSSAKTDSNGQGKKENYTRYHEINHFKVMGSQFALTENDFLVTFASFRYNELPDFITREEDAELKIQVDRFATVRVSRSMRGMMRKMNQYKKDKLTRRARKTREKLQDWKNADEIYFDKRGNNPLDPINLAEFILK